jgi:hypothetical protein
VPGRNSAGLESVFGAFVIVWTVGGGGKMHLFGPTHDRKRPQSRREPGIQHIFILFQLKLGSCSEDRRSFCCLFDVPSNDPILTIVYLFQTVVTEAQRPGNPVTHILLLSFKAHKVSRATMSPPKLPRDTPVLYIFEPAIPFGLGMLGADK